MYLFEIEVDSCNDKFYVVARTFAKAMETIGKLELFSHYIMIGIKLIGVVSAIESTEEAK